MTDEHPPTTPVERRLDQEYAAERGTTLSAGALENEEHPEIDPDSPGQLARKVRAEAGAGEGVIDKAKRALQEIDRDVSGEYERRDDPDAPPPAPRAG